MTDAAPARLVVVCGLPGSGKTTLAHEIAASYPAIAFCPDEWLTALGVDLYAMEVRRRLDARLWELAQELLALGVNVVVEFFSWGRNGRDVLREHGRAHGYAVELRYLDVPFDELWRRIERRNATLPWGTVPLSRAQMEFCARLVQVPDADEMALFDPPLEAGR